MKALVLACALCGLLWLPASAQRGGMGGGVHVGGFGGRMGVPRPVVPPIPTGTTGIPPLGTIPPIGSLPRRGFGRFSNGGFGYPGYYGYGDDGYAAGGYPYQATPTIIELVPEGPARPPEAPAQGIVRDYTKTNPAEPSQGAPAEFSVVSKDHMMRSAVAVWAQEGKLHYIDRDGAAGVMPLADVDRAATQQANDSKGLHLQIPVE